MNRNLLGGTWVTMFEYGWSERSLSALTTCDCHCICEPLVPLDFPSPISGKPRLPWLCPHCHGSPSLPASGELRSCMLLTRPISSSRLPSSQYSLFDLFPSQFYVKDQRLCNTGLPRPSTFITRIEMEPPSYSYLLPMLLSAWFHDSCLCAAPPEGPCQFSPAALQPSLSPLLLNRMRPSTQG